MLAPAGVLCRPEAGPCDVEEVCSGASAACPPDGFAAAGTVCRPAGLEACDPAEVCTGTDPACPDDAFLPDGAECSDGMTCNGVERCVSGVCAPGTALDCDDGDVCTADACREPSGCSHTPIEDCCVDADECDDGDACTRDTCSSNRCRNEPIPGCGGSDAGASDQDGGMTRADGGVRRPATGGGCSCRVPGASGRDGVPPAALFALLALALVVRRRHR
jgi:MYXO-CTERM domain-containing protein